MAIALAIALPALVVSAAAPAAGTLLLLRSAEGSRASPVPTRGAKRLLQHFNCSVYRVRFQRHTITKQNRVI